MKLTVSDNLFKEFPPVTPGEWEEKIAQDISQTGSPGRLVWNTPEGFSVNPFYTAEDLSHLGYLKTIPGEFPFIRGFRNGGNDWIIRQDIPTPRIPDANQRAIHAIGRGARAIGFNARELTSSALMRQLLEGIDLSGTPVHFFRSRSYPLTAELLFYEIERQGLDPAGVHGSFNFDPVGYLLAHGNFWVSLRNNLEEADYLIGACAKRLPRFRAITVNGYRFQEAGASLVQELAFGLATGNEYLSRLTERGFTVDELASRISFSFGLGPSYFMEIAKLRAARLLWSTIVSQYNPEQPDSCRMYIHGMTARWNKTRFDPYVNLLRTTTEGMAGILGNANSLSVFPFDIPFGDPTPFAERLARNQQLILKEESYLDKVVDPAAGSYYVENLTDSMARHAWSLFQQVEAMGGMVEAVKQGVVQELVEGSRKEKETALSQRNLVLLGTNQYPNPEETILYKAGVEQADGDNERPAYKKMTPFRVAEPIEELRLATERHAAAGNQTPSVFLLATGHPRMAKARAGFTTNFFGCAGFRIIDNPGFATVNEGVGKALASQAELVVVCSSDEEYPRIVPEMVRKLKERSPSLLVLVAGYPRASVDELRKAGVDGFIHAKSSLLDELTTYQHRLGIQ